MRTRQVKATQMVPVLDVRRRFHAAPSLWDDPDIAPPTTGQPQAKILAFKDQEAGAMRAALNCPSLEPGLNLPERDEALAALHSKALGVCALWLQELGLIESQGSRGAAPLTR
jgi:hypothetical protein